ncbi:MAG: hypothetical protein NVSMB52_18340 [Chloroflexota bacterium]
MTLVFRMGADVQQPDGGRLGELHRIVYNPATERVVSVVVLEARLDGREVIVPLQAVTAADDEALTLSVSEDQFIDFEFYSLGAHNIAPPPDSAEFTSDIVQEPLDVPDVPPIGAATGIESIAFTPLIEEEINVDVGDQVIDGQTTVWATDGEVGRVSRVRVSEETHMILSIVVEKGLVFKQDVDVPISVIENVQLESVILSVAQEVLEVDQNDRNFS